MSMQHEAPLVRASKTPPHRAPVQRSPYRVDISTAPSAQRDAYSYLEAVLGTYGLESLTSWAWEQIVAGANPSEVLIALRQQGAYQERFSGMIDRQKNGYGSISESDYIAYESAARNMLQANGLSGSFTDHHALASLIANDVTVQELGQRIDQGYRMVHDAAPEVRQAFGDLFGASGDAALASFFLDPTKAEADLSMHLRQADVLGTGRRFGIDLGADESLRFAQTVGQANLSQGFGQAHQLLAYTDELPWEQHDLTGANAAEAAFGVDPNAEDAFTQRQQNRAALGRGSESFVADRSGVSGLRSAR